MTAATLGDHFHPHHHKKKANSAEKSWLGPDFIQADDPCGPERFRVRFLLKQARRTIIFGRLIHASEWISTC